MSHLVAEGDLPGPQQLRVGRKVVDDLRHQPPPVDGVGAGQADVPPRQLFGHGLVGKDPLDAGLGVVKVAPHRVDRHIGPLLGGHLQPLDLAGAAGGVKDRDLHPGHVVVAVQGGLAGVAAGGHQDEGLFGAAEVALGLHQKLWHQLQRVILEGAGGAVPQLQRPHPLFHRGEMAGPAAERGAVGGRRGLRQEGGVRIGQVFPEDGGRHGGIIQPAQGLDVHLGEPFGDEEPPLFRQALHDGLRGGHPPALVSGAEKLHLDRSFLRVFALSSFPIRPAAPAHPPQASKALFIICTIHRPLSRGATSATSKRAQASVRPLSCKYHRAV